MSAAHSCRTRVLPSPPMSADDWNFLDLMATILIGTFIAYIVEGRAVLPDVGEDPRHPRASKVLTGFTNSIPYTSGIAVLLIAMMSYHEELRLGAESSSSSSPSTPSSC